MKLVVCALFSAFISSSALASGWFPKLPDLGKLVPKNDHPWNEGYDLSEGGDNTTFGSCWQNFDEDFKNGYNDVVDEIADTAAKWGPAYWMAEAFSHKIVVPAIKSEYKANYMSNEQHNGGHSGSDLNVKLCRTIGGGIIGPIIGTKAPVWCASWTGGDPIGTTACVTGLTTSAALVVDIACDKICEKK